jgi:hypothetical protein
MIMRIKNLISHFYIIKKNVSNSLTKLSKRLITGQADPEGNDRTGSTVHAYQNQQTMFVIPRFSFVKQLL